MTFDYDAVGHLIRSTQPNGIATDYDYDLSSRLIGITYKKGSTVIGDLTYQYDSTGRRGVMGGTFARTGLPQSMASATYNDANQLTQKGSTVYSYDANGNLTGDGANTYTWDARNQLTSISGPSVSASFQYDAFGRRTNKTVNSVSTSYLYDGYNVVQELSGATPTANLLVGSLDGIFSRTDGSGTLAHLRDGLGSTIGLADSSGVVQTSYTFEPFGQTSVSGATSGNPSQYTSRENDGTGLYYYRARYYNPTLQRFISQDPLGIGGGDTNLYAYTGNNPINFNDPFGLEKSDFWDDFYKKWEEIADIRAAQEFWRQTAEDAINDGNWVGATGADLMNLLLDYSGLADIQEDAEILGSDAPIGDKIVAGGEIVLIGASWYGGLTGKEIVIGDPKKCRIAPFGNRNWRKGYQKPHINQLPHYHRKYPGPGGSYKWHRRWQKGF